MFIHIFHVQKKWHAGEYFEGNFLAFIFQGEVKKQTGNGEKDGQSSLQFHVVFCNHPATTVLRVPPPFPTQAIIQ